MFVVIGAVVALVVMLATIYRASPDAWRLLKAAARAPLTIEAMAESPRRLEILEVGLAELAAKVTHEFSNNGGSTMRDRIDATHTLTENAARAVGLDLEDMRAELTERYGGLDARVTRLEGRKR